MNWTEFIPSILSAIASIAAAIAAIVSLRISKRSTSINELAARDIQHHSASIANATILNNLGTHCLHLLSLTNRIQVDWVSKIEYIDNRDKGGDNPRPIRHVVYDGGKMLSKHLISSGKVDSFGLFEVLRCGFGDLNESEYFALLKKADGAYTSFDEVFGAPSPLKPIAKSLAFRWTVYQMLKRLEPKDLQTFWISAWCKDGFLSRYKAEFEKVRPELAKSKDILNYEKLKLECTSFPLSCNKKLSNSYEEKISAISILLDFCDPCELEEYLGTKDSEVLAGLILCSLALLEVASKQLGLVSSYDISSSVCMSG